MSDKNKVIYPTAIRDDRAELVYNFLMFQIDPDLTTVNHATFLEVLKNLPPDEQEKIKAEKDANFKKYEEILHQLEKGYGDYLEQTKKDLFQKMESMARQKEENQLSNIEEEINSNQA